MKDYASQSSSSAEAPTKGAATRWFQERDHKAHAFSSASSEVDSFTSATKDRRKTAELRSSVPQASSSSSAARTYALPKEPPVRFDMNRADVAEHIREPELPEVLPQLPIRLDKQPKADEIHQKEITVTLAAPTAAITAPRFF